MRVVTQMEAFQEVLENFGLTNLGFVGLKFIRRNNNSVGFIAQNLHLAVENRAWLSMFVKRKVQTLPRSTYDHNPIFLTFIASSSSMIYRRKI